MNNLDEIIKRKIEGTDCNEEESGLIKQFIKKEWLQKGVFVRNLDGYFPLECNEAILEYEQDFGEVLYIKQT